MAPVLLAVGILLAAAAVALWVRAARRAALFRAVFLSAPQPAWIYDRRAERVVAANPAALAHYKLTREQFLDRRPEELMASEQPELHCGDVAGAGTGLRLVTLGAGAGPRAGELSLHDRHQVLEMIAQNEPLEAILDHLARLVEQRDPAWRGMLTQLRNGRLYPVASCGLPAGFLRAGAGLHIGEGAGAAPWWSRAAAVFDLANDERWAELREHLAGLGPRTCWSLPIVSGVGEILGVLAVYVTRRAGPEPAEQQWLEAVTRLAAIAMEQRHLVDELAFQSRHDSLTKLCNRLLLEERLERAASHARQGGQPVGLLHINLDRFRVVNSVLGHKIGDGLLRQIAARLGACMRKSDTLARAGGDEFVALLAGVETPEEARGVAQKLLDALQDPFCIEGHEVFVTASVGVGLYPWNTADAALLERNAHLAMRRAKRSGGNAVTVYDDSMQSAAPERLEIEAHLRRALDNGEFSLHFQPQIDLADGRVCGAEALLRWKHPHLGMVSPATFIPIAEETGLIIPVGAWAIREACRQARRWRDQGLPPLRVAVNVSPLQFERGDFVELVEQALAETAVDPTRMELELTENMVMSDVERSLQKMRVLRSLGLGLALDDFGTGHSSLAYLQRLPVDKLKVDQSFVREIRSLDDRPALVCSVLTLAHALGLCSIAEGIETAAQLQALVALDCQLGQGYLLSKPLPVAEFARFASWAATLDRRVEAEPVPPSGR